MRYEIGQWYKKDPRFDFYVFDSEEPEVFLLVGRKKCSSRDKKMYCVRSSCKGKLVGVGLPDELSHCPYNYDATPYYIPVEEGVNERSTKQKRSRNSAAKRKS
jgi:hypothetical protein